MSDVPKKFTGSVRSPFSIQYNPEYVEYLEKKQLTYRQARRAVELFESEWIGQDAKKLWAWAVEKAQEQDDE